MRSAVSGSERGIWVRCDGCDDYWCTRHEAHTADCECPEIQDWDTDPYTHTPPAPRTAGEENEDIMATYTFKRYTWGEYDANNDDGLNVGGVDWDAYTPESAEAWDAFLAQAGWVDCSETGVGVLTREWNGHPKGAWIISDDARPGLGFAVSNEASD